MPAAAIPGFYYDEAKKKYFKILPNHVAPTGAKYSVEAAKREEEEQTEDQRNMEHEKRVQKERIKQALRSPLTGMVLKRETGALSASELRDAPYLAWASNLERQQTLQLVNQLSPRVGHLTYDHASETYICALSSGPYFSKSIPWVARLSYDDQHGKIHRGYDGVQIQSLSLSPQRTVMFAMDISATGKSAVLLHRLASPEEIAAKRNLGRWGLRLCSTGTRHYAQLYRSDHHRGFFSSVANPFSTSNAFAIGTARGTCLVTEAEAQWQWSASTTFSNIVGKGTRSDILAVSWLDANVVVNGSRDRKVLLWDTRDPAGTALRFMAPSTISHVKALDANRILVAGIEDKLQVYDLRHPHSSRPWLTFPAYKNRDSIHLGLDTHANLVAAGQTDHCVRVFDSWTGKEIPLRVREGEVVGNGRVQGPVACVKFVDGEQGFVGEGGGRGLRLVVAGDRGVENWGF